jgi:plasmid stability protein
VNLNIREFPDGLARELKVTAVTKGVSLREFVIEVLQNGVVALGTPEAHPHTGGRPDMEREPLRKTAAPPKNQGKQKVKDGSRKVEQVSAREDVSDLRSAIRDAKNRASGGNGAPAVLGSHDRTPADADAVVGGVPEDSGDEIEF